MNKTAMAAIVTAISALVGIFLFTAGRPVLGLVFIALFLIGLMAILFQIQLNIVKLRDKQANYAKSLQLLTETSDAADKFLRDTLIRTIKNQVKGSDERTVAEIKRATLKSNALTNDRYNAILKELTSLPVHSNNKVVQGTPNSLSTSPQTSLKPKETDYSGSFQNLEDYITGTSSRNENPGNKPRVIFVSSNGAGLGHLTRLSAVDKAIDAESMFYTMSSAYKMLGKKNHEIVYFPSHGDLKMRGSDWNPLMQAHFTAVVRGYKPDLIVFDGTYVYRGVIAASKELKIPLVWMQRGCWKDEVDKQSVQRHNAQKFAKSVLIPGDYGCEEIVDVGPGLTPEYLPPITLVEKSQLLTRENARKLLHLPLDKKLFLIQLGAGNINDISNIRSKALTFVKTLGDDWEPVLVQNPLSQDSEESNSYSIQAYPLSLYYNAFDAGAFAAGYNTVQESIELQLPAVFVPNPHTKTDDQERRANTIAKQGLGFVAGDEAQLQNAIHELSKMSTRESIRAAQALLKKPSGATAAAKTIHNLLK